MTDQASLVKPARPATLRAARSPRQRRGIDGSLRAAGRNACLGLLCAGLALMAAGPASAQICDPADMPALAVFGDTLLLPSPEWTMSPFYPEEGTHLDQLGNSYYELENEFKFFGIPAVTDAEETEPAQYFLPAGWRDRAMITFDWNAPSGTQILREPTLRSGGVWVQDPAAGSTAADTMLISPQIVVYGGYTGFRDQRFVFEYSFGDRFFGDLVASEMDPGVAAWDISSYTINDTLWYEYPGYETAIGETITLETAISWKESYSPDPEFGFAPDDPALSGRINLYATYQRSAADRMDLLDTNIGCAHGLFPSSWYPDGDWDPETDPSAYGLYVSFTPGVFSPDFRWNLVAEQFEGYLVWRRVIGGGEGWTNIWKLSRNEERDKEYWWWIAGEFSENAGPPYYGYEGASLTPIFSSTDERLFLDFDVHNGFEYAYALTTFDRGFRPNSGENDHYILSSTPKESLDDVAQVTVFNRPAGEILDRRLYAVPNPLRTGKSAFDDPNYHNFPGKVVRFVGVTANTTLKVYTLSGDLVFVSTNSDPSTQNIIWDTRNLMGEFVASGVYVFRAEGEGDDEEYGKLIIIR